MWLFRKANLLEWNILHRIDHLIIHPKIANIFDHIQASKTNSWKTKHANFFCFRQVYFTNCCQQISGCLNQPFIIFIHHIWGETVLFIIQTSDRMRYFTIFQDKLHSVNIQDDQSWALSETVQKFTQSPNYALLGLCVWKSCEKGVKSVWKKGTMWNQCWQKYKFTTSAFHMHVNFLTCMWNFVIHVKKFCHMCEFFFHAFYFMWNLFIHVKQFCHACEIWSSHA